MRVRSLRTHRLDGGGGSLVRTRLPGEIPDLLGEYREIFRNQTLLAALGPKHPNMGAVVATAFLRFRKRKLISTRRKSLVDVTGRVRLAAASRHGSGER